MKIRTMVVYGLMSGASLYLTFNPDSRAFLVLCLAHGVVFGWLGELVEWLRLLPAEIRTTIASWWRWGTREVSR